MKSTPAQSPTRYSPFAVTLHWLTVILMFGAVMLVPEEEGGFRNASPIDIHMVFGALLAIVLIARLIVRFTSKRPAWASTGNTFLDFIGEATHYGLYFFAFVILAGGAAIAMQRNLIGYLLGAGPAAGMGESFIGAFHVLGWFFASLLILLHVGGALYHQFLLKDNLMKRMWYGK
jgi:cytochrome b561